MGRMDKKTIIDHLEQLKSGLPENDDRRIAIDDAIQMLTGNDPDTTEMKLRYAGVIGLLCSCSVYLPEDEEEKREAIMDAAMDWCQESNWRVERTLNRIDVVPSGDDGK